MVMVYWEMHVLGDHTVSPCIVIADRSIVLGVLVYAEKTGKYDRVGGSNMYSINKTYTYAEKL